MGTMIAVIQAGGKGTRLRPYTLALPKPLMPIGDCPIIEVLLKWLRRWGVKESYITLGYLGGLIRALCGDGSQWDMKIEYSQEPEPLGTIDALRLIQDKLNDTFLTINGDIISDMNLREFVCFHKHHGGPISVGVAEKNVKIDLGVLTGENGQMMGFQEKPAMKFKVSMGIYCMEPEILDLIPHNVPFGFDDLMYSMLDQKMPVHMYHHQGLWLDIGREEDFRHAQEFFLKEYKNMVLGC
jgi:mannose-1-phosphate guanylyltransferase